MPSSLYTVMTESNTPLRGTEKSFSISMRVTAALDPSITGHLYLYFVSLPINWIMHRKVITEKCLRSQVHVKITAEPQLKIAQN